MKKYDNIRDYFYIRFINTKLKIFLLLIENTLINELSVFYNVWYEVRKHMYEG